METEHHALLREATKHYMEKALANIEHMTGKHPVTEDEQKDFAYDEFNWGDEKETSLVYEFMELVIATSLLKIMKGE